jgi:hypothetical protein
VDPHLERLQREIASASSGLSSAQLSWHPPGKWCAAEVFEHLFLTYTGTIKGMGRMLESGGPRVTPATWRQLGRRVVVLGLGHMPSGRIAPPFTRPKGLAPDKVLGEIAPKLAEIDGILSRCSEKFGPDVELLDHPILGPLTATQWSKFHLVHGLHHLKQVRELRNACPGLPE